MGRRLPGRGDGPNTGTTATTGWTVTWTFANGQTSAQFWNGIQHADRRGGDASATPPGTARSPAGGTTTAGFLGTRTGQNAVPTVSCSRELTT